MSAVTSCLLLAVLILGVLNAVTIALFAIDKQRAINGEWRIRESTLLSLALLGGSPGAVWARTRFRHKTRKQPFATVLDFIGMLHAGLTLGGVIAFWL